MHRSAVPLGLLLAALAGCASTQSTGGGKPGTPAYVDGTWMGSTSAGASTYVMVLKQTGNSVKGTLSGAGPQVDGPIEGSVDSNSIQLSTQSGYRETPLLRASCERISGNLGTTTVDMRRATPYTVDGTWAGGVSGSDLQMVMVLKQTGNNVTGTLSGAGPISDGPLDGTVQGNTIQLKERMGYRETPQLKVTCEQISGSLYDGRTVNFRRIP
jgi:hypothetical protein